MSKIQTPSFSVSKLEAMMRAKIEEREEISMIGISSPRNSPLAQMVSSEEAVGSEEVEIREAGIVEVALELVAATMRDLEAEAVMVLVVETKRDLAVEEERMPQDLTTCFLTRISPPCEKVSLRLIQKIEKLRN